MFVVGGYAREEIFRAESSKILVVQELDMGVKGFIDRGGDGGRYQLADSFPGWVIVEVGANYERTVGFWKKLLIHC